VKTAFSPFSRLPDRGGHTRISQQLDTLTLERAVVIALEHQPALHGVKRISGPRRPVRVSPARILPFDRSNASGIHTDGVSVVSPSFPPGGSPITPTPQHCRESDDWDFGKTSGRVSQSDYSPTQRATTTFRQERTLQSIPKLRSSATCRHNASCASTKKRMTRHRGTLPRRRHFSVSGKDATGRDKAEVIC